MQKERVSSRTIQFQESVEIIEIPREDSGTRLSFNKINKGPSSDSCSIGTKTFKSRINILIGIVLICVVLGTAVRIVFSEKKTTVANNSLTYNEVCRIDSNQCDSRKNLYCNNGRCQCDHSIKYWDIDLRACLTRHNYSQMCRADSDCLPTLICPTISGVCNCSQYLPDLVCNCANTKYYNPILSQCVNRASIGGSCMVLANYTCLISLYCNAGTCVCPIYTKWVAANTACVATG